MDLSIVIITAYFLICGVIMVVVLRGTKHPVRTELLSAGGGILGLCAVCLCGVSVPLNFYSFLMCLVLGIPGVLGITVMGLL